VTDEGGSGSVPIIETTAGFVQVIDWMSSAMVIGDRLGEAECFGSYVEYLTNGTLENNDRIASHQPLEPVFSPCIFARRNRSLCPGISVESFRAHPGADGMRELLLAGSLKFLLAHELGHHLLGHVGTHGSAGVVRDQKKAADEFAFHATALSGSNPIEAMPVLMLFGALEGFSLEGEEGRNHPAGVRRFVTMVEAGERMIANDEKAVAYMRSNGTYNKFVARPRNDAAPAIADAGGPCVAASKSDVTSMMLTR
jgi:hypothetical protein